MDLAGLLKRICYRILAKQGNIGDAKWLSWSQNFKHFVLVKSCHCFYLKYGGHLFTALFKYVNGTTCYSHKMWWKYETSAQWVEPLRNLGGFTKMIENLGFHFPNSELFRWKNLDVFFFAISLSFNILTQVGSVAAVKVAKESVAIQGGCGKDVNKIGRTSWI